MTQLARPRTRTTTDTMRAAVILEPRKLDIREVKAPRPGPTQVRVQLEGCGVCASNIPPWEGRDWFEYPMKAGALGHEGWGVVDQIGDAVTSVQVGDRVAMMSDHAYAEFDVAEERHVVKLPRMLKGHPFPGEPLGCAMNIFSRSDIQPGQTVAILGIGFLGSLLTQLCERRGARVIAVSRRTSSLDTARAFGALHAIDWQDRDAVISDIAELTDGVGGYGQVTGWCDRVIECTGKQEGLDLVGEITRVRGTAIIAGFHQDGPRSVDMQLWNWRGLNIINAHEREPGVYLEGMQDAITAIERGQLHPEPLLSHAYPLNELDRALEDARQRPEGFTKGYITMPGAPGEAGA